MADLVYVISAIGFCVAVTVVVGMLVKKWEREEESDGER